MLLNAEETKIIIIEKKKKKKDVRSSWKVTFDQHIIIIYKKANAKLITLSSVVKYICKSPTIVLS